MTALTRLLAKKENLLLLLILAAAAFLRFYKVWLLNYTHDELSALSRVYFANLTDLINFGVKSDFHPAGVQLFLYYWVKAFGNGEFVVKLPFLITGVVSVYLIYQLGKSWFNVNCGLLSASVYSVFQFGVFYSQIARPYGSGVFFMLVATYGWTRYLFGEQKAKDKKIALVLYCVGLVACAYNHHFSAVSAMFLGITGLFFLKRSTVWPYLIASAIAIAIYAPHLPVTLHQLGNGGIGGENGWLGKPEPRFILDFFGYTAHYSWLFGITLCIILISGAFWFKQNPVQNKFRWIGFGWFIITFLLAYFYSILVNPIIQFSTLIFCLPFLILGAFSFLEKMPFKVVCVAVSIILLTGSYSLAKERRHYEMMFNQPFDFFSRTSIPLKNQYLTKPYLAFVNYGDYLMQPSREKYGEGFQFLTSEKPMEFGSIATAINQTNPEILFLENINPAYVEVLKYQYPFCMKRYFGFGFAYYALAKFKPTVTETFDPHFYTNCDFKTQKTGWNFDPTRVYVDATTQKTIFRQETDQEFGPGYSTTAGALLSSTTNLVTAEISFKPDTNFTNAQLVISIEKAGESLLWSGSELKQFVVYPNKWNKAAIAISNVLLANFPADAEVKIYLWNQHKQQLLLSDFEVKIYPGNEKVYGVVQSF